MAAEVTAGGFSPCRHGTSRPISQHDCLRLVFCGVHEFDLALTEDGPALHGPMPAGTRASPTASVQRCRTRMRYCLAFPRWPSRVGEYRLPAGMGLDVDVTVFHADGPGRSKEAVPFRLSLQLSPAPL